MNSHQLKNTAGHVILQIFKTDIVLGMTGLMPVMPSFVVLTSLHFWLLFSPFHIANIFKQLISKNLLRLLIAMYFYFQKHKKVVCFLSTFIWLNSLLCINIFNKHVGQWFTFICIKMNEKKTTKKLNILIIKPVSLSFCLFS